MGYLDFLCTKTDNEINPALKPHQRDAVKRLLGGGGRAAASTKMCLPRWTERRIHRKR